ncbi:hypothetical protein BDN70DRAFT_820109, partial [Pholiota conissans]
TQTDYILEFESRVPLLLKGLLSRETIPSGYMCQHCAANVQAIWRCRDCTSPYPLCRCCMRQSHMANSLHRVECWTGKFYRRAHLWEVGAYLLVPHHHTPTLCASLSFQTKHLEALENIATPIVDAPAHSISSSRNVPRTDAMMNTYVCVVHTNGIHDICLVYCTCQGVDHAHADLLNSRLIPSTFEKYSTIFTTAVLDDFRLANLETKASTYQYFQTLRRKTNPTNPAQVPDRYRELLRLSREWRLLKKAKWWGFAHTGNDIRHPMPGQLTLFCPACPQPHVNLPDNWSSDPDQTVYLRSFVADGNFKADHVYHKNAMEEVWLAEGGGMMPKRDTYKDFLSTASALITKAPCQNLFRVIETAMMLSRACDINGVVCIACARHGCYAPNSLVNLSRGEQHKNVDFAFLSALRTTNTEGIKRVLLLYDIGCQYSVNFAARMSQHLPEGLTVDHGIGMFHVHGHQEQCFYRFAPSFIPGAGNVAGEILESLWSELNQISSSTRSMTLPGRAETLDDHTSDSNFRKTIGMSAALCKSFSNAVKNSAKANQYYEELLSTLDSNSVSEWEREIARAEQLRSTDPAAMDILKVRNPANARAETTTFPEPLQGTIESKLGLWFQIALQLEEKQADVRQRVRDLQKRPTDHAIEQVQALRQEINNQFSVLESTETYLGVDKEPVSAIDPQTEVIGMEEQDFEDEPNDAAGSSANQLMDRGTPTDNSEICHPEQRPIPFPSNCSDVMPLHRSMKQFIVHELKYRLEHVSLLLGMLREAIAERSIQYSRVKRKAPNKGVATRSITKANKKMKHIIALSRLYRLNRLKLVELGADSTALATFKELTPADVKTTTAVMNPNQPGSRQLELSWIWRMDSREGDNTPEGVLEFQRIHYLRARAHCMRWKEELNLVSHEMVWTTRSFMHQIQLWNHHAEASVQHPGLQAYAFRKAAMWKELLHSGEERFRKVNQDYTTPYTSF